MVGADVLSLTQIADRLEAQQGSISADGAGDRSVEQQHWRDAVALAKAQVSSTVEDLVALARICRCARNRPIDAVADLSHNLDLELQTAVITLLSPMKEADSELIALHHHFMALEYHARTLPQRYADDDDAGDEVRETLLRQQKVIVCQSRNYRPTTLAGYQAVARMLLAWNHDIKPTDQDNDPGESQLLWLLLHSLLGAEQATALASEDPDVVLQAIGDKLDRNDPAAPTNIAVFPDKGERIR